MNNDFDIKPGQIWQWNENDHERRLTLMDGITQGSHVKGSIILVLEQDCRDYRASHHYTVIVNGEYGTVGSDFFITDMRLLEDA